MTPPDDLSVKWILRSSQANAEKKALEEAGQHLSAPLREYEPTDRERARSAHAAFEPLTILVAAYTLILLAERIARMIRSQKHGGIIIDCSTSPAVIREEQAVEPGVVYVIKQDGVTQLAQPKSVELLEVLRGLPR
jgi:hypothetical protein